ncbi:MAG: preprotein translocase subunit YajC [Clostridia bacterium]|nr:preprotein translocase subunit YajC [Clostridia bacterium]
MFLNMLTTTGTGATAGTNFLSMLPSIGIILVLVVAFYFLLIRPQRKREKQETEMRSNLSVGDEITTTGGIVGRILSVSDDTVVIGTSGDCTKLRIVKGSIARVDKKVGEPAAEADDKDKNDKK